MAFFSLSFSLSGSLLILPEGVVVVFEIFAWAPKSKINCIPLQITESGRKVRDSERREMRKRKIMPSTMATYVSAYSPRAAHALRSDQLKFNTGLK